MKRKEKKEYRCRGAHARYADHVIGIHFLIREIAQSRVYIYIYIHTLKLKNRWTQLTLLPTFLTFSTRMHLLCNYRYTPPFETWNNVDMELLFLPVLLILLVPND